MKIRSVLFNSFLVSLYVLCSTFSVFAQEDDSRAKKQVGWRYAKADFVVIYGNKSFAPDTANKFLLTDQYYFKINQEESYLDPKSKQKYVMIILPKNEPLIKIGRGMKARRMVLVPKNCELHAIEDSTLGQFYWLPVDDDSKILEADFEEEYSFSRYSLGALSLPFKLRFDYKSSKIEVSGESTVGISGSIDLCHNRDFGERVSLVFAAGVTTINPNSIFNEDDEAKLKNVPGLTFCGGLVARINRAQIGMFYGYDLADEDWHFDRKPWLSFGVGFAFLNPPNAGKGN